MKILKFSLLLFLMFSGVSVPAVSKNLSFSMEEGYGISPGWEFKAHGPVVAGVNFHGGASISTIRAFVEIKGCDNNPFYRDGWRMLFPERSFIRITFALAEKPARAFLEIEHLSSLLQGAIYGGYSPAGIYIENKNGKNCIVKRLSPGSHGYGVDSIEIGGFLEKGTNCIELRYRQGVTHYWIRRLQILAEPLNKYRDGSGEKQRGPGSPKILVIKQDDRNLLVTGCSFTHFRVEEGVSTRFRKIRGSAWKENEKGMLYLEFEVPGEEYLLPDKATLFFRALKGSPKSVPEKNISLVDASLLGDLKTPVYEDFPVDLVFNGEFEHPLAGGLRIHAGESFRLNISKYLKPGMNSLSIVSSKSSIYELFESIGIDF